MIPPSLPAKTLLKKLFTWTANVQVTSLILARLRKAIYDEQTIRTRNRTNSHRPAPRCPAAPQKPCALVVRANAPGSGPRFRLAARPRTPRPADLAQRHSLNETLKPQHSTTIAQPLSRSAEVPKHRPPFSILHSAFFILRSPSAYFCGRSARF